MAGFVARSGVDATAMHAAAHDACSSAETLSNMLMMWYQRIQSHKLWSAVEQHSTHPQHQLHTTSLQQL